VRPHSPTRRAGESPAQRAARIDAIIAARVPDIEFAVDAFADSHRDSVGLVGHSFGGWSVLATPDVDSRIATVVAHAPGGSSQRRPGILPLSLDFRWTREVPTLFLAGDADVPVPLDAVTEVFSRTPPPRRMFVLRRADHQHFVDDVERVHEIVRTMEFPPEAAWIPAEMRPADELCSGEHAHQFVRALTLAHLDATLRESKEAQAFRACASNALSGLGLDAHEHGG
jgi:pimeloyl-ACP methyl ester carboxylesterase